MSKDAVANSQIITGRYENANLCYKESTQMELVMSKSEVKYPQKGAVKALREAHEKLKKRPAPKELVDLFKKEPNTQKNPLKRVSKSSRKSDLEI
jgi:hypothetical protein